VAIQYTIDRARQSVFTVLSGKVTLEQFLAYYKQLRSDPEFDFTFDELISVLESARMDLNFENLSSIRTVDPFSPESKRAVVAPIDVNYGISRMYGSLLDRESFRVFRTLAEAEAFLDNGREDS
jgi:hypothetical protein